MHLIFVTYIIQLLNAANALNVNESVQLIREITQTQTFPFVCIFSCSKQEKIELIKQLSTHGIRSTTQVFSPSKPTVKILPQYYNMFFIVDFTCPENNNLLLEANKAGLLNLPYRWLLLNVQQQNYDLFKSLNIGIDSDFMVVECVKECLLNRIYSTSNTTVWENFATWTYKTGLTNSKIDKKRHLNLAAVNVCIVLTNNDSINHLTDKRNKEVDSIAKLNYVLVQHLQDYLNATFIYAIEDSWGYKEASGWSGMLGRMIRQEADIGGTPLFMTTDRYHLIDFVVMTSPTRSKFIFRKPKLSYVSNVYILPFHWSTWVSLFGLILIIEIVLYVVNKWDSKKKRRGTASLEDSWIDVTFLVLSALCQQGSAVVPSSVGGRIVTIFLFLSLMFLYTSYSANIVALLQSSSNTIQTLKDLLNSPLDVGVDDTPYNRYYIPRMNETVRKKIYLKKIAPQGQKPKYMPTREGITRVRNGHFAFHAELGVAYKLIQETFQESEKCGLQEIQYLEVADPWLSIRKNTPYKKMVRIGLMKILESGLGNREAALLYTKKPVCNNRGSGFISVGLMDCYLATLVLFIGIVLSTIILVLELAFHKKMSRVYKITHINGT